MFKKIIFALGKSFSKTPNVVQLSAAEAKAMETSLNKAKVCAEGLFPATRLQGTISNNAKTLTKA